MGAPVSLSDPLTPWFPDAASRAAFARKTLGRACAAFAAKSDEWRGIAPPFAEAVAMAASGLPFQIAAGGRYDRSGDARKLKPALAAGKTVYLPQVHQVLPRLARLMTAIRASFVGPFREECSFLFVVEGRGRPGMGLHHDGEVESFWLQLEGARTITYGPPVPPGTPEDLDPAMARPAHGFKVWTSVPGTVFYLPPRAPHGVVCRGRSLAISLTFGPQDPLAAIGALLGGAPGAPRAAVASAAALRRAGAFWARRVAAASAGAAHVARAWAEGLASFDVVAGQADEIPRPSRDRLFTQVPAVAGPVDAPRGVFPLHLPGGETHRLAAAHRPLAARLETMPTFRAGDGGPAMSELLARGIVAFEDLPLRILPESPGTLDGWRFA